jgi:hypothetical protein
VAVPTPEQEYRQTVVGDWQGRLLEQAAGLVRQQGYNFSVDELRAIESGYFEAADQKAYLAQHPELKAYWDAKKTVQKTGLAPKLPALLQDAGVGPGELEGPLRGQPGVPALALKNAQDQFYTSEQDLTERAKFGDDILDLEDEYKSLDTAGRRAWRAAHPREYDRLQDLWGWRDEQAGKPPYQSGGGYSSRNTYYRRSYSPRTYYGGGGYGGGGAALPGATPIATDQLGPDGMLGFGSSTLDQYNTLYAAVRAIDPAFDQLTMLLFGGNIAALMQRWYAMTPEERAAWQAAHAEEYLRLVRFWTWLSAQQAAGLTGRGTPFARQLESVPPGAPVPPSVPNAPSVPASAPITPPALGV